MALPLNKLESPSPKDALCKVWLKLARWFWRIFLKLRPCFTLFRNYLPLEKCGALYLKKRESRLPKEALCQIWLKVTQWFSRFLMSSMFFRYFLYSSSWKRAWPLILTNLNPLYPRRLCAKFFFSNWSSGS